MNINLDHVKKRALYAMPILSMIIMIVSYASMVKPSPYYDYDDFLGPLSSLGIIVPYIISLLIVVTSVYICKTITLAIALFISAVMVKYFLPCFFDHTYIENFYDAGSHIMRGAYVTITGHSDPMVDEYFDVQPGFFWWTAIYINVVFGPQTSLNSWVFEFFTKWFNMMAITLYIPILVFLFKRLGLSLKSAFLACTVFVLLLLSRVHYSAQEFSWLLYWLLLAMLMGALSKDNFHARDFVIPAIIMFSLVFIHEGTTLFTVITLFSLLVSIVIPIQFVRVGGSLKVKKYLLVMFVLLISLWLIYLNFFTIRTFENFIWVFNYVMGAVFKGEVAQVVASHVGSPHPIRSIIVIARSLYMVIVVLTMVFILFLRSYKGDRLSRSLLTYVVLLIGFIVPIALALGGTGYIGREFTALAPVMAFTMLSAKESFSKLINMNGRKKILGVLFIALLSSLCVVGGVFYFFGWNFQSVPYSERVARYFLINFGPNIANVYPALPILSLYFPQYPYASPLNDCCVYVEEHHNNIQAVYYTVGNPRLIEEARIDLTKQFNLLYSSPTTLIFTPPCRT